MELKQETWTFRVRFFFLKETKAWSCFTDVAQSALSFIQTKAETESLAINMNQMEIAIRN